MHLEQIHIENFRCLPLFETQLNPGRILIVGDNARGKTTLLEAVFYLVSGRSFRTRYDNDCVPWGAEQGTLATIRGRVRRARGDSCRLSVTLGGGVKSVRVDDKPLAQLADLWGNLHAVLFTPDDLELIKGGPGERRRYLDIGLSQIDRNFLFHLQRYGQALRQRNALLKQWDTETHALREQIAPWDEQLVEHGLPILQARFDFLHALEPRAAALYDRIVSDAPGEKLRLKYANFLKTETPVDPDDARTRFRNLLHANLEEDLRRRMTCVGPHRDDFAVLLSDKIARDFASQGQVRSCVLALRLAEVFEMENRTGEAPLVLLDDLASELDSSRKKQVLDILAPEWQTFLTTTRRDDFPPDSEFSAVIHLPEE